MKKLKKLGRCRKYTDEDRAKAAAKTKKTEKKLPQSPTAKPAQPAPLAQLCGVLEEITEKEKK